MLGRGGCSDEVGNGFGLGEVYFPGEESALGKFSGLGHVASVAGEEAERLADDVGGSVAGNLYAVFAGI